MRHFSAGANGFHPSGAESVPGYVHLGHNGPDNAARTTENPVSHTGYGIAAGLLLTEGPAAGKSVGP